MALSTFIYQTLFRRTSTFAVTIVVGAVIFERVFDQGGDAIFEQLNRGVRVSFCAFNLGFNLTLQAEGEPELMLARLARPNMTIFAPVLVKYLIIVV